MTGNPYNPALPHPFPEGGTIPRHFYKTVAASGTPEALGTGQVLLKSIMFVGQKSAGVDNVGDVFIQTRNATGVFADVYTLSPSQFLEWKLMPGESIRAIDFYIRVGTNGDGVKVLFHER